jgi:hypothetical protein
MYRDGMYNLCVASLNKYITSRFYMKHSRELLKASQALALKEVELRDLASRIPNSPAVPSLSKPETKPETKPEK